jgi:hypothetical protein
MADNFYNQAPSEEKPEVIKLGDKEFTQEELNAKIGLAEKIEQLEKAQGQPVDEIVKSWGQRGNAIGDLKKQLEEKDKALEAATRKPTNVEWTQEMKDQAKAQLEELLGGAPVTNKGLEDWYAQRRYAEKVVEQSERLQKEIDGTDGRPKFVMEEVIKHMGESGFKDPLKAYKDLHDKELDEWSKSQLDAAKGKTTFTTSSASREKQPEPIKVTKGNLSELVGEALGLTS